MSNEVINNSINESNSPTENSNSLKNDLLQTELLQTDLLKSDLLKSNRRQFIQGFTKLIGGVAAGSLLTNSSIAVAMAYTKKADSAESAGKLFSQKELHLLKQICAIVIPKTDTPGAAEVDVHGFIDNQLFHCFSKQEQQIPFALFKTINKGVAANNKKTFEQLTSQQQFELLTNIEKAQNGFTDTDRGHFKFLKHLICFGYYTSEVGASQELAYQAIPGGFKGSISYESIGKSWGSLAYY